MKSPFNAAKGAPPTLEWVSLDRLHIDDRYQRAIADSKPAQALINRIARDWDWRLFQPLSVARRAAGELFVIDGQHRLAAATLRGDLPHLPCVIAAFAGVEDEAAAFAAMNRQRRAMSKLETYRAEIAAGDTQAVLAMRLIEQAGLSLARTTNPLAWAPGQIDCIGGVVRVLNRHGRQAAVNALTAMGEAWGQTRLSCPGSVLAGLADIYLNPPPDFDPDALIDALSQTTGRDLLEEAGEWRNIYSKSEHKMRAAILARMAQEAA
jgi:hypothetical protein